MRKDPQGRPLPVRVHWKHGRYWYVHKNKWRPLAVDYFKAIQQVGMIEAPSEDWSTLVAQVYDRFEARHKSGELAAGTMHQYRGLRARIEYGFAEFTPNQIRSADVTTFLDLYENTPNMANRMLTVLKAIFEKAVRQGLCDTNPAYGIKRFEERTRTRYLTDAEYRAIRMAGSPTVRVVMDLCYLTAQRIGDVLQIRQSDISREGITFQQQKTGKRLMVSMTPELDAVVQTARGLHKVTGMYLLHPKGKTSAYKYFSLRDAYRRAVEAAGVPNTTLHDIRAKALTDAKREGHDATALAGHASAAMTARYIRLRETDTVSGPSMGKVNQENS
jgi:integrase